MTGELDKERLAIRIQFRADSNLNCFFDLYAIEEHASPVPIDKAYVDEVTQSKIILVILGKELREAVVKEFETASINGVKIFCYIKKGIDKTTELERFIKEQGYTVHCGDFFTPEELVPKIKSDLMDDIIKSYANIKSEALGNNESNITRITTSPTSEYRFFPVDYLIEVSKKEELATLDKNQLISLAVSMEEQYGDYRTALMLLEIGLLKEPNDWMLHNNRGVILDKMGLLEPSLFSYKKVLKIKPDSDTALYNVGNILMHLGRTQEAITYLKRCLELFPGKIGALNNLTSCYLQLNRPEEALSCAEEAMKMSEDVVEKANYAIALSANSKHEQAIAICEELHPYSYYQSYTRAKIYFNKKEYEKSIVEIDSILQVGALDYPIAIDKFYCLSALGRIGEAREWIGIIEENYPVRSYDYNNLGFELMNKYKLYEESILLFRKSLDLNPNEMIVWNNLQSCYGYLNEFPQALLASEEALKINSFDQKSIKNKMSSLTALGRFDEALSFAVKKGMELFQNEQLYETFEKTFKLSLKNQGTDIKALNELIKQAFLQNLKLNEHKEL